MGKNLPANNATNVERKYQHIILYLTLSLLASVGENIFSTLLYRCPCNSWNLTHSLVFLLVPALLFFFLGYLLNGDIWKKCQHYSLCSYNIILIKVTVQSSLAPLIWINMALIKVGYYECIISGSPWKYIKEKFCGSKETCIETLLPCGMPLKENITKTEIEEIQSHIKSESQVLSSVVLACLIVVGLVFICLSRITQENVDDQPNSHRNGETSNQLQQHEATEQTLNDQTETEA